MKPHISFGTILLAWLTWTCESPALDSINDSGEKPSIIVFNHTGHDPDCGTGILVRFELSAGRGVTEVDLDPDFFRRVVVNMEAGDALTVRASQLVDNQEIFLVESDYVYRPDSLGDGPEFNVVLCPKDQLTFRRF